VLVVTGIYAGIQYLDSREGRAQQELGKAMELYHAQIDPTAPDDPYGKGPSPVFKTDTAKYQFALKAFSSIIDNFGSSKQAVVARYYVGLSQLQLGQEKEALQTLAAVGDNTKDRTVGYLAKKVLSLHYLDKGNYKGAQEILEGMLKDPQCSLPKEDLRVDLSRVYVAEGKKDQAVKVLTEGREPTGISMLQSMLMQELTKLQATSGTTPENPAQLTTRP